MDIYLQGMRDRSMRSGTELAREIKLTDWSMSTMSLLISLPYRFRKIFRLYRGLVSSVTQANDRKFRILLQFLSKPIFNI